MIRTSYSQCRSDLGLVCICTCSCTVYTINIVVIIGTRAESVHVGVLMRKGGIGVGGALVHTYTCSTTCMYIYVLWLFLFLFHVGSNGCTHFHVSADQLCLPTGNGSYSLTCTDHFNLDSNNNCRGTYVYYSYVYVHHLYCILKSSNT